MRVISRPRQGGKTHEMVEWAKGYQDRVVLVIDESERRRLVRQYGLTERQVLVAQGAVNRLQGRRPYEIGVDNIDLLDWRTLLGLGWINQYIELVTETRP